MKTIYVDLTNFLSVPFLTGIQRVVRELAVRLLEGQEAGGYRAVLLSHDRDYRFFTCDNGRFLAFCRRGEGEKRDCVTEETLTPDQLDAPAFWFDPDGIWHNRPARADLYAQLKKRNVRIGVYVHDVIVLTHPQYVTKENLLRFPPYLAAVYEYADVIFTGAHAVREQIQRLAEEAGCARPIAYQVTPPGANFAPARTDGEEEIDPLVREIARRGKVLLTVSTIEARKNHKALLDAFDAGLSQMGYQMVFVGRAGWRVEALLERIRSHPQCGKSLFHLQGLSDASLRALYRSADFVLFPSYTEGYGLSTVEALQHGVPAILSDVPVMREVGGALCDYFDPDDPAALVEIIRGYAADPERYRQRKERIADYRPPAWDDCAAAILREILTALQPPAGEHRLEQIVYLSARADNLLRTLEYVEAYMPFIRRALVLCPEATAAELKARYAGRLGLSCVPDGALLGGRPLPRDHATRNFLLRCLAMQRPELDEEFVMSDDDYRPLEPIDPSFFIRDGRYQAYAFYDLDEWFDNVAVPTSYDMQMLHTRAFLKRAGYPTLQYASHMPQVIRKAWYRELLAAHPGIEETDCDEWSTYFNYAVQAHPLAFDVRPYETLGWPDAESSWDMTVFPPRYAFENYYDALYDEGGPFFGMSRTYGEATPRENEQKRRIARQAAERAAQKRAQWRRFTDRFIAEYGRFPDLIFRYGGGEAPAFVHPPRQIELLHGRSYSLPIQVLQRAQDGGLEPPARAVRFGCRWDVEGILHGSESVDGRAVLRVTAPEAGKAARLKLYYALDGEKPVFACEMDVRLTD